jgi:hypothetical protein
MGAAPMALGSWWDFDPALPGWADVWRAALRASMGLVPEAPVLASTDGRGASAFYGTA